MSEIYANLINLKIDITNNLEIKTEFAYSECLKIEKLNKITKEYVTEIVKLLKEKADEENE